MTPPGPPAKTEQLRLPSKFGWLLRFGWRAAGSRSQFEHWLQDPEAQALLAASPRARRIVRRLCHMLGIELPEVLRLPPRPKRKRQRARKPDGAGTATGSSAEGSPRSRAVSRRAGINRRPTKAEMETWWPGQKRPMPWSSGFARNKPPVTIWPWPEELA
ncbi:MAG: hypothetical protein JOZ58_27575 [Acetobacteraceae bacterium]|nr:hypothetical protein [Acetobacteraceae bacterium]